MKPRRQIAACIRLLYLLANGGLWLLARSLWPRRHPASVNTICVCYPAGVGDFVVGLPALDAIRKAYPGARLCLLTWPERTRKAESWRLLEGAGWIDEFMVYPPDVTQNARTLIGMIVALRRRRFDLWFHLPRHHYTLRQVLLAIALARLARPRWAGGFGLAKIRWAMAAQSEFLNFPNQSQRLLAVLAHAGVGIGTPRFPLPVRSQHHRAVCGWLEQAGLEGLPLVALAPGALVALKRWPAARFAAVGRELSKVGYGVVVLGSAEEAELGRAVAEAIGAGALNLAGRCSLLESAAALKHMSLLICNDSGLQHLAAAVGTPCVAVFHFADLHGTWHPWGSAHTVLKRWVECHSCNRTSCAHQRCLTEIGVAEVIGAALRKLRSPAPDASGGGPPWRGKFAHVPDLRAISARRSVLDP
ncbi:MAG TPA: glycosyltransferase family 9 protein [Candidatus Binataceae bacterium]|nr:glycosyltransferase family 9 protein [Candidatus Binataceae bacterium]